MSQSRQLSGQASKAAPDIPGTSVGNVGRATSTGEGTANSQFGCRGRRSDRRSGTGRGRAAKWCCRQHGGAHRRKAGGRHRNSVLARSFLRLNGCVGLRRRRCIKGWRRTRCAGKGRLGGPFCQLPVKRGSGRSAGRAWHLFQRSCIGGGDLCALAVNQAVGLRDCSGVRGIGTGREPDHTKQRTQAGEQIRCRTMAVAKVQVNHDRSFLEDDRWRHQSGSA